LIQTELYYNGFNMRTMLRSTISPARQRFGRRSESLTAENTTTRLPPYIDYKTVIHAVSAAVDSADEIAASTKTD
jgi:hypothetical protein